MQTSSLGITDSMVVTWPETGQAWLLLVVLVLVVLGIIINGRRAIANLSKRHWVTLFCLSLLALSMSQLFPLQKTHLISSNLSFTPSADGQIILTLLSPVPYLLAGALLGPIPALFVGFFTGLGRVLGVTHLIFDPFNYALAAWMVGKFMQQNYRGRLYCFLRSPLTNGLIGEVTILLLSAGVVVVSTGIGFLASLDAALFFMQDFLVWSIIQGLFGGIIAAILVFLIRRLRNERQLVPSPSQKSVQNRLNRDFLIHNGLILSISTISIFILSLNFLTRQKVSDMAAWANGMTEDINAFQSELETDLLRFGGAEILNLNDKSTSQDALSRLYHSGRHYQKVLLVDDKIQVNNIFPTEGGLLNLTEPERSAVAKAMNEELKTVVIDTGPDGEDIYSLVVPVRSPGTGEMKALIGRVAIEKLGELLIAARSNFALGTSLILGDSGQIIAQAGDSIAATIWLDQAMNDARNLEIPSGLRGKVFLIKDQFRSRELVYQTEQNAQDWAIAVIFPYESVLGQALLISFVLFAVLVGVSTVSYYRLVNFGRELTTPISELSAASKAIASGGRLDKRIRSNRQDEIGELSLAFIDMQRELKSRLDELSLLLSISQDISSSINIHESIPAVLQGALRGTGASGARAVILNPHDSYPIAIDEGPAGKDMALFDRYLMTFLRDEKEISLNSSRAFREIPDLAEHKKYPIHALYAVRLRSQNKFQGVLYLGFRQAKDLSRSEKNLLKTLAGHTSVLVENAYLYANAESGQRRMAAILSSISEAVIVTDRTGRILMINRAMEQAFQLMADRVVGRTLKDVIESPELIKALSKENNGTKDLELRGKDRRFYYANAATIVSQQGEIMGRVAVLHDITQLKEIDRMKSDFVSSVSHDLRTPLTVMSGYATALSMMDDLNDLQRDYADNIVSGVERMVGLVDNLLDLGRIEAGVDLNFQEIDIAELLRDLADEHWLFAHESGVRLRVEVAENLPKVSADRNLLERAVSNLLSNGFKYAPNSGDMKLAAHAEGDHVVVTLRDRGPGIARLDQMQLFEKFYRVKRHGAGKTKGSGLGLAIVRSVAELHGGSAWCQSELGKGSIFYFSILVEKPRNQGNS